MQVERIGEHVQAAVRLLRPHFLRPVPIKLDTIVVGVAQIKRLGDAVVAGAFERDLGDDQTAQRVGQKRPGRVQNRGMVKAGRAGRRWGAAQALPGVEADMVVVAAGRDEGGAGPAGGLRESPARRNRNRAPAAGRRPSGGRGRCARLRSMVGRRRASFSIWTGLVIMRSLGAIPGWLGWPSIPTCKTPAR